MNKGRIVICRPVMEGDAVEPGTEQDVCPRCKTEIWVDPDSRRSQKEQGAGLLCAACALDIVTFHSD